LGDDRQTFEGRLADVLQSQRKNNTEIFTKSVFTDRDIYRLICMLLCGPRSGAKQIPLIGE
jgi:hypothetical protein